MFTCSLCPNKKMQHNTKRLRYFISPQLLQDTWDRCGHQLPVDNTTTTATTKKSVYGSAGKPGGELRGDAVPPDSVHIESVDIGLSKTPIVTPVIVQELRRFIVIVFNNVTQKVVLFLENAFYVLRPKMIVLKSQTLFGIYNFFPLISKL